MLDSIGIDRGKRRMVLGPIMHGCLMHMPDASGYQSASLVVDKGLDSINPR